MSLLTQSAAYKPFNYSSFVEQAIEHDKLHWEDLVQAMKPQLDAMQKDLHNKGSCFARLTDKGIQFIPCEDVYVKEHGDELD